MCPAEKQAVLGKYITTENVSGASCVCQLQQHPRRRSFSCPSYTQVPLMISMSSLSGMMLCRQDRQSLCYHIHVFASGSYGYVVLFAAAFPLAPLVLLINNIVENATDGFKIFQNKQRPAYVGAQVISYPILTPDVL